MGGIVRAARCVARLVVIAAWVGAAWAPSTARAIGGPENVALVVNADSWSSVRVANEYVRLRRIPAHNVIRLSGLGDSERTDVETFRQKILLPVLKTLEQRGLVRQIDAVVYSTDIPATIDVRGDIGDRKLPPVLTPDAAINGLTYLYGFVLAKDIRYLDFQANLYARRLVGRSTDTPWTDAERERYGAAQQKMNEVLRQRRERATKPNGAKPDAKPAAPKPAEGTPAAPPNSDSPDDETKARDARERETLAGAAQELGELRKTHPRANDLLYNLACLEALLDRGDDAIRTLGEAVEHGWFDHRHAQADPDFQSVRGRPEFQAVLEKMKNVPQELQPLQAFRGLYGWSPQGLVQPPDRGPRYLVSTVLSCTTGRGLSVSEALLQLRRSADADSTRPAGTIYFPHNGDVRSTTREWGFRPAAASLEKLGVRAVVEPGVLPQGKNDVAGAVIGTAGFDWPKSGSTILPGAICEHLTSFGGMLGQDAGQTPLSEFLRHGAAGSSGTVTEPYAIQAKFPTPFVQTAYANGYTLGEAFYQSVSGPYQLLIVGDVLCRPWGAKRTVTLEGTPVEPVAGGMLTITPKLDPESPAGNEAAKPDAAAAAASASGAKPAPFVCDLFLDGRLISVGELGKPVTIDASKLADGRHELVATVQREIAPALAARAVATFVVKTSPDTLTISAPQERTWKWDRPLAIDANLPGARQIELWHDGRSVGKIDGAKGTFTLAPRELGVGPVRLRAIAQLGEREVWSDPLDLEVVSPEPLAALTLPVDKQLHDGLSLQIGAGEPVVVAATRPDWGGKANVAKGTPWTLTGWFEVAGDDIYHFQLDGDAAGVRILVDDQPLDWPRGERFWQLPVSLAKGWHRVTIESSGDKSGAAPGIRFGGPGTRWLEGVKFRHLKPGA